MVDRRVLQDRTNQRGTKRTVVVAYYEEDGTPVPLEVRIQATGDAVAVRGFLDPLVQSWTAAPSSV